MSAQPTAAVLYGRKKTQPSSRKNRVCYVRTWEHSRTILLTRQTQKRNSLYIYIYTRLFAHRLPVDRFCFSTSSSNNLAP